MFTQLDRAFSDAYTNASGGGGPGRDDWEEVEGCWVLRPPDGVKPKAVVQFVGGAFVGASPNLTYKLFLERLSERGFLVVAAPHSTSFNYAATADEVHFKFARAAARLEAEAEGLPVFGVGHSLGCVLHLLIGSRYPVQRQGNVFMSFNNRPATDAIPLFSPVVSPAAAALGPLFRQLAESPLSAPLDNISEQVRSLSPPVVQQFLPLLDQLRPLYEDLAAGTREFSPAPKEIKRLIKGYYGTSKNFLIRFRADELDETPFLTNLLQNESAISPALDLTVRTLPGDHTRPLQQNIPDLPPELLGAVSQGSEMLDMVAGMAGPMGAAGTPLGDLAKGVKQGLEATVSVETGASAANDVAELAEEIAGWIDLCALRLLPASTRRD